MDKISRENFGQACQEVLQKWGMKQVTLAKALSVSPTMLSRAILGAAQPHPDTVRRCAPIIEGLLGGSPRRDAATPANAGQESAQPCQAVSDLRQFMRENALTIKETAKRMARPQTTVRDWASGKGAPNEKNQAFILDFLHACKNPAHAQPQWQNSLFPDDPPRKKPQQKGEGSEVLREILAEAKKANAILGAMAQMDHWPGGDGLNGPAPAPSQVARA